MKRTQPTVLGQQVDRARREHKLSRSILAMLSGLTEQQVQSIEEGGSAGFVNDAHRIDCARRIAVALGLDRDHFLQQPATDAPAARDGQRPGSRRVPREQWQQSPLAALDVLARLPDCELPPPPADQRRQVSPTLAALLLCLLLSAAVVALASLH